MQKKTKLSKNNIITIVIGVILLIAIIIIGLLIRPLIKKEEPNNNSKILENLIRYTNNKLMSEDVEEIFSLNIQNETDIKWSFVLKNKIIAFADAKAKTTITSESFFSNVYANDFTFLENAVTFNYAIGTSAVIIVPPTDYTVKKCYARHLTENVSSPVYGGAIYQHQNGEYLSITFAKYEASELVLNDSNKKAVPSSETAYYSFLSYLVS